LSGFTAAAAVGGNALFLVEIGTFRRVLDDRRLLALQKIFVICLDLEDVYSSFGLSSGLLGVY